MVTGDSGGEIRSSLRLLADGLEEGVLGWGLARTNSVRGSDGLC